MLNSFPLQLLIGILLGFLSGLGVGGGSLLLLWLTLVLGMNPEQARLINLIFFLPAAAVSCLFRLKEGTLKIRPLVPAIISGCAAAALFSWIGTCMDTSILRKIFGVILLATGLRELFYRPRNDR